MTSLPGLSLAATNSVNCEKLGNLGIFYGLDPVDGVMLMIGESDLIMMTLLNIKYLVFLSDEG